MTTQTLLTEEEWTLIRQLVEKERGELRPEIHHTDNPQLHARLLERLEMVDRLLDKLTELTRV